MRIGIICHPTYGGSGIVAAELAKLLARGGHIVHLFSYALPVRIAEPHENVVFHRVEVSSYPLFRYPSYDLELAARIVDVARTRGLDVLHAHYAIPHGMSAYLAKTILADEGVTLPFATTLHGTDITIVGSQPSFFPVTRHILDHSDALTAVSGFLAGETRRVFGISRPVRVVPNFIDPPVFRRRPAGFRKALAPNGEALLVHLSNFRPIKNIPSIIQAFEAVRRRVPSRLILVGDGPERDRAVALCRELGICEAVVFAGMQANVADYLAVADVYLQASETESFGLSILEAMACGVPVVATDVGGVPEVVVDRETGLLVPLGDVSALTNAVLRLLKNSALRRRLGRAGRERARALFSPEPVVAAYGEAYQEAISCAHQAAGARTPPGSR